MIGRNFLVLISLFLLTVVSFLWAKPVELKPNHPTRYVVQKGDTLWDIAGKFLNTPAQWPELWHNNPDVHDPHRIFPGDKLRLTMVNGKPSLSLEPRVVKLSPTMQEVTTELPVPPVAVDVIKPFLTRSLALNAGTLRAAPYIVAHNHDYLLSARGRIIYARGLTTSNIKHYAVYRQNETYFDPRTKKPLAIEARYVGTVELQHFGDPSTLQISKVAQAIHQGDRLLPEQPITEQLNFIPHSPSQQVRAQIISVLRGITRIGRNNVVVLNYGKAQGANAGEVLNVYRSGRLVHDPMAKNMSRTVRLPATQIGQVMVFKVFDRVSFALVINASRVINLLDEVRS